MNWAVLVEAFRHCATFRVGIEAQLSIVRPEQSSVLVFLRMKTIKLSAAAKEHIFQTNDCVSLGLEPTASQAVGWEIHVMSGCLWLSFESPLGKHSATPLIDVALRVGQRYPLPTSALRHGIIVSSFEQSSARFCPSIEVTSCDGKNNTLTRFCRSALN
jgi:hypothetical protein